MKKIFEAAAAGLALVGVLSQESAFAEDMKPKTTVVTPTGECRLPTPVSIAGTVTAQQLSLAISDQFTWEQSGGQPGVEPLKTYGEKFYGVPDLLWNEALNLYMAVLMDDMGMNPDAPNYRELKQMAFDQLLPIIEKMRGPGKEEFKVAVADNFGAHICNLTSAGGPAGPG